MKRILSLLLTICIIASFFVGITPQMAQAADVSAVITDAQSLKTALKDETVTELVLSGEICLNETMLIPAGRPIMIRADPKARASICPGVLNWPLGEPLFKIQPGANVTFKNITLNGNYGSGVGTEKRARGIYVEPGGANITLDTVRQGDGSFVLTLS